MTNEQKAVGSISTRFFASILPGLALVGFTIGTGSVTSMVKAGADYGMALLWALALSCIVTYFLFEAFGRLTLVTEKTMLRVVWEKIHPAMALFICVALVVNVSGSIMGVMGIIADVLHAWSSSISSPGISAKVFAGVFSALIALMLILGNHKSLQSLLAFLAGVMGVCFIINALKMLPNLPSGAAASDGQTGAGGVGDANFLLVTASMVGTTVAPIVLIFRSIMLREQEWGISEMAIQRRDARISSAMIFLVSGAIMVSAAASLHVAGFRLDHAKEMIPVLEPIAGRFAVIVFVLGITAAGVSSQFPNVVAPAYFVNDLRGEPVNTRSAFAIAMIVVAASLGMIVPIFKARPVLIMLASQALGAVLLPVTVGCIFYLLNRRDLMHEYKNTKWQNVILALIQAFALAMGIVGLVGLFG